MGRLAARSTGRGRLARRPGTPVGKAPAHGVGDTIPAVGRRPAPDRGSGLLAAALGLPMVLVFVVFAAHLLIYLHTMSLVTSLGHDAASTVARTVDAGGIGDTAAVEVVLRERLGELGSDAELSWTIEEGPGGSVRLQMATGSPTILPTPVAEPMGLATIHRRVSVRLEQVQQ